MLGNKSLLLLAIALLSLPACKSRPAGSQLRTISVPGSGYYRVAFADQSARKMVIYEDDQKSMDIKVPVILDPVTGAPGPGTPVPEYKLAVDVFINSPMQLFDGEDRNAPPFPIIPPKGGDPSAASNGGGDAFGVNYGWEGKWKCADAKRLLRPGPNDDVQLDDDADCIVQFNTEDESWYSIAVLPVSPTRVPQEPNLVTALNQARLQTAITALPDAATPTGFVSNPLKPGDVNVGLSDDVKGKLVDVMVSLYQKYQSDDREKRERNTCLKNGRAKNWLDLQAHFYCLMPYSPARRCYSTPLALAKEQIVAIAFDQRLTPEDRQKGQLQLLFTTMWKAYEDCRQPRRGLDTLSDEEAGAFKLVMFVQQGIMDFNVDDEQAVINAFYERPEVRGTDTTPKDQRPRRVTDPYPQWHPEQGRYMAIRMRQAQRLGLAPTN